MRISGYGRAQRLNESGNAHKLCIPISDEMHDRLVRLSDELELPVAQLARIAFAALLDRADIESI